ncbi:hypothetical protein F4780DRAFT_494549 [Xylariomycetidae sp. FL0641]|nr:hypothetical protein F4780DRAFT_494549 [Xylariomycetidae sp. FL0641]
MLSRLQSPSIWTAWLLAAPAYAGSIAAWYNTRGPNLVMQDDDTGDIRYSLCNGNYTPIFPDDASLVVPLDKYPPKKNTSLACAGWFDGTTTVASLFYIDSSDAIVNSVLNCDWDSGEWRNTGDYIISNGAPKLATDTSIAAVLLGSTEGYRVFYNDLDGTLQEIGYTSNDSWSYKGVVSHDKISSSAISVTYYADNSNMTILRPRDSENIGVSQWHDDGLWWLTSFPEPLSITGNSSTNATDADELTLDSGDPAYELPSWSGSPSAIAAGIDNSLTRYAFYIGTDKKLYQIYNGKEGWLKSTRGTSSQWPDADTAGGYLGISSDYTTQEIRLYYMSGGKLVEVASNDGQWADASTLASVNATQAGNGGGSTSGGGSSGDGNSDSDGDGGGLSSGAKAGISAGVTIGVVGLVAMLAVFWFLRRRQRKHDNGAPTEAKGTELEGSNGGQYMKTPQQEPAYAGQGQYGAPMHMGAGYPQAGSPPAVSPYSTEMDASGQPQQGYPFPYAYQGADAGQYQHQHQQQQPQQYQDFAHAAPSHPQELPAHHNAVEMMGEGHYKEVP